MRIDWYTKAVLTVIAVALVAIAAEDYVLPAQAQSGVIVQGGMLDYETDFRSGETLFVHCTNCR